MGVTGAGRAGYYIPSGCHAQDGLSSTQTRHGREGQDTHRYSALSPVTDHASRSGSRGEDTARNNRSMMQTARV